MQKKIRNNVVDNRLYAGMYLVEDVTTVDLPELKKMTSEIYAPGMGAKFTAPDSAHFEPLEFTVNHNSGVNSDKLMDPEPIDFEFRLAIQDFSTASGKMGLAGVKYRIRGVHTSRKDGTVERGNPLGKSDTYSILRYEVIENGRTTFLVDVLAGRVVIDGKEQNDGVSALLDN